MASISISSPVVGWFFNSVLPSYIGKLSDAVIQHCKYLAWLESKGRVRKNRGGDGIEGQVRLTEDSIGGATSDLAARMHRSTTPPVKWRTEFVQYDWPFLFSLFRMERWEGADAKAKLINYMENEGAAVRQSASAQIARHLNGDSSQLTGDIATPMDGLQTIILNTGTYNGISRSTYSGWQAQVNSVANFSQDDNSNDLTNGYEAMESMYLACCGAQEAGGENSPLKDSVATDRTEPELILTTQTGYLNYEKSLEPRVRYTNKDTAGPIKGLAFKNAMVDWDNFVAAGIMWFLNSEYLDLYCVGNSLIRKLAEQDVQEPWVRTVKIGGQGQHFSRNPRYLGKLSFT